MTKKLAEVPARNALDLWLVDGMTAIALHLHNENGAKDFIFGWIPKAGPPAFARSKKARLDQALESTVKSMRREAASPFAYVPFSRNLVTGESVWGAIDIDYHSAPEEQDLNRQKVRDLRALWHHYSQLRGREDWCGIHAIAVDSGRGVHFWLVTLEPKTTKFWESRIKELRAAADITWNVETFPTAVTTRKMPKGLRLPGSANINTWNPATGDYMLGLIAWENMSALLPALEDRYKERKKIILFSGQGPEGENIGAKSDGAAKLAAKFEITLQRTRHETLLKMMTLASWHYGRSVALRAAEIQYARAVQSGVQMQATDEMHLAEAANMFDVFCEEHLGEMGETIREALDSLPSEIDRNAFLVIWNFAKNSGGRPFPCASNLLGDRIGVTWKTGLAILQRFTEWGILEQTAKGTVGGGKAGRYRWKLPGY